MTSSWIHSILYRRTPDGSRYLAILLKSEPTALLYKNPPSWMKGLILAGKGGKSIGSAYSSLLKREEIQSKYEIKYQRIEGREKVNELKKMMKG